MVLYVAPIESDRIVPQFISGDFEGTTGFSAREVTADAHFWLDRLHPEDREKVLRAAKACLSTGRLSVEYRWQCADGQYKHFLDQAVLLKDSEGSPMEFAGSIIDVTDQRSLETQLIQAQKMDAIGKLTGGIAHDFNNLLMAIMSNAELAALELAPASPVGTHIDEIKSASRRARALTQQLLAFSRKQMLQPRVLDMNLVVRESEQILRRLIGENIAMEVTLENHPWNVRADQGQLAQVLMNLIVNARDALPQDGQVRIDTANRVVDAAEAPAHRGLREGEDMTLRVGESRVGMDEDTKARIFEPFFTTKPPGQGTGLGLSTAYGIVKQSGGYIAVDSTLGEGTLFTVYLPRVREPSDPLAPPAASLEPSSEAQGTILLVEDEVAVREATKRMLRKFGFSVVEAKNGQEAIKAWEEADSAIDVVLTDVVMPTMGGAALVKALRARQPGVRVVFMSGYTQGALQASAVDEARTRFLPKPFTADQLVRTLRELVPSR